MSKPNDRALIRDPRQTDLEEFTNPTVVEVVSYFTCHDCERHWYVQLPEVAGVATCACGTEVEPYETEEVDG